MKVCRKCKKEKELTEFYKQKKVNLELNLNAKFA